MYSSGLKHLEDDFNSAVAIPFLTNEKVTVLLPPNSLSPTDQEKAQARVTRFYLLGSFWRGA